MKIEDISAAVEAFRAEEMKKVHQAVNSAHIVKKDDVMADGIRAVDRAVARYAHSLGAPDDEAQEEPAAEAVVGPAVQPGTKAKVSS